MNVLCRHFALFAMGIGLLATPYSREYPASRIREEQTVRVNGVAETWHLRWAGPTKPFCGANENSAAITCPCEGFAYGEEGDLYLVRFRNGTEIDRFHVTPLFEEQPDGEHKVAVVQRWLFNHEKDFDVDEEDTSAKVAKRPPVRVMHMADYDHDGNATEFYLQTESLPCGKSFGVVIGISKTNPQLHAFSSVNQPDQALYLQKHEWEALRDASGPTEVLDWECQDHGAQTQTRVRLGWTNNGIEGVRRQYKCTSDGKASDMIDEEPL